ncbi:U3 snoRNP protein, partial [Coemansia spiralis]
DEVLPYYERLVRRVMALIRSESIEVIEAACNALAYLFKYLAKNLIADLRPTFTLMAPMLGVERQRGHIRRFVAESMAFMVRKLRGDGLQQFTQHVIHSMLECPPNRLEGFRDGVALLYFECMRGVDSQLYSRAPAMLTALLRELYKEAPTGRRLEDNDVYVLVASVLKLCLHYAKREPCQPLWVVLLAEYDAKARAVAETPTGSAQPLACLLGLLATATLVRKGSRVSDYQPLLQRCATAFTIAQSLPADIDSDTAVALAHERVKLLVGLLLQSDFADVISTGKVLLDTVFACEPLPALLSMATTLARLEWTQWNQVLLPYLVRLTVSNWATDSMALLLFWAELFQQGLFKTQTGTASSVVTSRGQILFPVATGDAAQNSVPRALLDWLASPVDWPDVSSQPQLLPADEGGAFVGFGDGDQDMVDESNSSSR